MNGVVYSYLGISGGVLPLLRSWRVWRYGDMDAVYAPDHVDTCVFPTAENGSSAW